MKRLVLLFALAGALTGCSWFQHGEDGGSSGNGMSGADSGQVRGTTGVSSGADEGSGITGSDLAPR